MLIMDLKQAEEFLIDVTENDAINELIENEIAAWEFKESNDCLDISKIAELFHELNNEIFQEDQSDIKTEALQWVVFDKIHDVCMTYIKDQFAEEDKSFFEKSRLLSAINVSAEQFGADENYSIPLSAAIVELSVLDRYKTPNEKINCLCATYDLVFAEIKTAMVAVIAKNSEKENEIPVIDNRDVIPVLMVVIIKSKLVHLFSNLFYIKSFYHVLYKNRLMCDIFKSFEKAVDALLKINMTDLQPVSSRMMKSIDLAEYMRITSSDQDEPTNRTLVDEANQRVLNLITKSTIEQETMYDT